MKTFLILLLFPFIGLSQTVDIKKAPSGIYTYQEVIEVAGKSKEQMYDAIKYWAATTVGARNIEIRFDDFERGKIICKVERRRNNNRRFIFSLTLDIKDEKYRITIKNYIFSSENVDAPLESLKIFSKNNIKYATKSTQSFVNDLHSALIKEPVDDKW